MALKAISELDVEGRRVLVRVDFDVPLTPARGLADGGRVRECLATVKHALSRGARVVLAAHLGRPQGRPSPELSLEPVGALLAEELGQEVFLTDEPTGDGARKVITELRPGAVALLENLRFAPGEEGNDERFVRALASYADVYINDALSTCHRPYASTVGIAKNVGIRGAGLALDREVKQLRRLHGTVEHPYVAVIGGTRATEKLTLMEALLGDVDAFYIGGAVANTFLKARGASLGRSLYEEDRFALARSIMTRAQDRDVQIFLPRDLVAAPGTRAGSGRTVAAGRLPDDLAALDIGPETAQTFADGIAMARTVLWTGPMGALESEPFAAGTNAVARAVANTRGGLTITVGRTTAGAVVRSGLADRISLVSHGDLAALELIEGRKLPGLIALET